MDLGEILRNAIADASPLFDGVKSDVSWEAWTGQDGKGKATYASPLTLRAIVDRSVRQRWVDGKMVTVTASLTILEPVTPNGAANRREPIDPRDRIILPGGQTGAILSVPNAVDDPGMARPFLNEVLLGDPS